MVARDSVGWDWRYLGFPTKRAVFVRLDRVLYAEVDDDEFEVFQVLEGVVDACCCRSPGPVWCEPESLEGVVFV